MFPPLAGLHHAAENNEGDGEGNHDDDVKHWASEESGIGRTEDFESIFGEATDAEAGRHARAVMWSVHRRLQRDDAMLLGYRTFARFLGYVVLFILVVYFQLQSLRSENRVQYGAVRSAVFGLDLNVTTDGSVDVSSHLASYAVLSDWVAESVIPSVWTLPSCGDAECTEELPGFDAGEGTRATFFQPQCPADCGVVETARVSVSFFDVGKLAHAFAMVEDVAGAAPVAGWNVCHASDREAGTPELVCVFDGDAFIDGRPYRTAELDPRDARFGGTKNLTLYGGDWELRYAFAGFDAGGADATGFPAIRGEICVADPDDNATMACERWDPCPAAAECVCEYVDDAWAAKLASALGFALNEVFPGLPQGAAAGGAAPGNENAVWHHEAEQQKLHELAFGTAAKRAKVDAAAAKAVVTTKQANLAKAAKGTKSIASFFGAKKKK